MHATGHRQAAIGDSCFEEHGCAAPRAVRHVVDVEQHRAEILGDWLGGFTEGLCEEGAELAAAQVGLSVALALGHSPPELVAELGGVLLAGVWPKFHVCVDDICDITKGECVALGPVVVCD